MVEFAERMGGIKASDIRQLLAVASKPDIISFAGGLPAPELFPVKEMKEASMAVFDEMGNTRGKTLMLLSAVAFIQDNRFFLIGPAGGQGSDLTEG